jgi:LysR family transcriptional activator of nhaA
MLQCMDRLNYQHLLYVWMVAREGTVARAAERLRLAPSTLSGQIHHFEDVLGEKLFARRGRRLELTESGRVAFRYADEIFSLGQEFVETLRGRRAGRPLRLVVGVLDCLPKLVVRRLLQPVFQQPEEIRVVCREDRSLVGFLSELVTFRVDVVLSDAPASPDLPARVFNHLLGESGTTLFAVPGTARRLRRRFPRSLNQAVLLPGRFSALHRALEQWFSAHDVHPRIVGEIDDSGLLKVLGEAGRGVFPGPSVEEAEIRRRYGVAVAGRAETIRQRYYAITAERRIRNPAVLAITAAARAGAGRARMP